LSGTLKDRALRQKKKKEEVKRERSAGDVGKKIYIREVWLPFSSNQQTATGSTSLGKERVRVLGSVP